MSADGFEVVCPCVPWTEVATIYRYENLFLKRTNMMSDMGGISWQSRTGSGDWQGSTTEGSRLTSVATTSNTPTAPPLYTSAHHNQYHDRSRHHRRHTSIGVVQRSGASPMEHRQLAPAIVVGLGQ